MRAHIVIMHTAVNQLPWTYCLVFHGTNTRKLCQVPKALQILTESESEVSLNNMFDGSTYAKNREVEDNSFYFA